MTIPHLLYLSICPSVHSLVHPFIQYPFTEYLPCQVLGQVLGLWRPNKPWSVNDQRMCQLMEDNVSTFVWGFSRFQALSYILWHSTLRVSQFGRFQFSDRGNWDFKEKKCLDLWLQAKGLFPPWQAYMRHDIKGSGHSWKKCSQTRLPAHCPVLWECAHCLWGSPACEQRFLRRNRGQDLEETFIVIHSIQPLMTWWPWG